MNFNRNKLAGLLGDLNGDDPEKKISAEHEAWRLQKDVGFYECLVTEVLNDEGLKEKTLELLRLVLIRRWLQELLQLRNEKKDEFQKILEASFLKLLLQSPCEIVQKEMLSVLGEVASQSRERDGWLLNRLLQETSKAVALKALSKYFKKFDGFENEHKFRQMDGRITDFICESFKKYSSLDAEMMMLIIKFFEATLNRNVTDSMEDRIKDIFITCMKILERIDPIWLRCQEIVMKLTGHVCFCSEIFKTEKAGVDTIITHIRERIRCLNGDRCNDKMYGLMLAVVRLYTIKDESMVQQQREQENLFLSIIHKALQSEIDEEADQCINSHDYSKAFIDDYFKIQYKTSAFLPRLNSLCIFLRCTILHPLPPHTKPHKRDCIIEYFEQHLHWLDDGDLKEKHFLWSMLFAMVDDGDGEGYEDRSESDFFTNELKKHVYERILHAIQQPSHQHPLVLCDVMKFLQWQRKQYSATQLESLVDPLLNLMETHPCTSVVHLAAFTLRKMFWIKYNEDDQPVVSNGFMKVRLKEVIRVVGGRGLQAVDQVLATRGLFFDVLREIIFNLQLELFPIPQCLFTLLSDALKSIDSDSGRADNLFVINVFACVNKLALLCAYVTYECGHDNDEVGGDDTDDKDNRSGVDWLERFNSHLFEIFHGLALRKEHQYHQVFLYHLLVNILMHNSKSLKVLLLGGRAWRGSKVKVIEVSGQKAGKEEEDEEDEPCEHVVLKGTALRKMAFYNNLYVPLIVPFFHPPSFSIPSLWHCKKALCGMTSCTQIFLRRHSNQTFRPSTNDFMFLGTYLLRGHCNDALRGVQVFLTMVEVMELIQLKTTFPEMLHSITNTFQTNHEHTFFQALCVFFGMSFSKLGSKYVIDACNSTSASLLRELCEEVFVPTALSLSFYYDRGIFTHCLLGALEHYTEVVEVQRKKSALRLWIRLLHIASVMKHDLRFDNLRPLSNIYRCDFEEYKECDCRDGLEDCGLLHREKEGLVEKSLKGLFEKHPFLTALQEYRTVKVAEEEEEDVVEKGKMKCFINDNSIACIPALNSYPDYGCVDLCSLNDGDTGGG